MTASHHQTRQGPASAASTASAAGTPDKRSTRTLAVAAAAQFHGVDLDPADLAIPPDGEPATASLVAWARTGGLIGQVRRLSWRRLMATVSTGPVVLLLTDGTAVLMVRADRPRNIVWLRDPSVPRDQDGVPVDELRLRQVWDGEALLLRP